MNFLDMVSKTLFHIFTVSFIGGVYNEGFYLIEFPSNVMEIYEADFNIHIRPGSLEAFSTNMLLNSQMYIKYGQLTNTVALYSTIL